VVYNNSEFGLIMLEAEGVGLPAYKKGIEFPNPDFATLACAFGGQGFRVTKPEELRSTISEAFKVGGPTIVDWVVAPDELPNFPHIELGQAEHYAAAKIKEAVIAVTGR
jgi:pyruvate dehydrogenase (quinone)